MIKLSYIIACLSLCFLSGCQAMLLISPAVSLYVAWKDGLATAYYDANATTSYNAVKRSLKDLHHNISVDQKKSDKEYYIVAGDKEKFKIYITEVEGGTTRIDIRINLMGDKPQAELVYKKITSQLNVIEFRKMSKKFKRAHGVDR